MEKEAFLATITDLTNKLIESIKANKELREKVEELERENTEFIANYVALRKQNILLRDTILAMKEKFMELISPDIK